ncbi:translocase of inner mitochondrial membrane 23 [Actinidia rufa]|uniref:Translocase of inner mitochondrial membrane 23 n=1 Tax=Actinidia rufa TaxID=165716 RepID=A0A7J0FEP4_9ERIC|nr:translocase of inner mitochondrial membrane 23 [Actinidia rufa]
MAYQPRSSNHNADDNDPNRPLYNPYQDLQVPIQTLYKLPTSPEFLFQEESLAQRRSWGENLTYYTGIGYLAGSVTGAGKGLVEGIKSSEPGDTMKLRGYGRRGERRGGGAGHGDALQGGVGAEVGGGGRSDQRMGLAVTGKQMLKRYVPI